MLGIGGTRLKKVILVEIAILALTSACWDDELRPSKFKE